MCRTCNYESQNTDGVGWGGVGQLVVLVVVVCVCGVCVCVCVCVCEACLEVVDSSTEPTNLGVRVLKTTWEYLWRCGIQGVNGVRLSMRAQGACGSGICDTNAPKIEKRLSPMIFATHLLGR